MTERHALVQALIRIIEVFTLSDADSVRARTLESIIDTFGAQAAGVVCEGNVIVAAGDCGPDDRELVGLANGDIGLSTASLEAFGPVNVLRVPIDGKPGTMFVVARTGAPFSGEESVVVSAMVRLMRYGVRTIGALDESQRVTGELESQVVANRELAEQLAARHASLVRRLLQIQRAVTSATPSDEAVEVILDQTKALFGSDMVVIRRIDTKGDERSLWTTNIDREVTAELSHWGAEQGISGRAIAENHLVVDDHYRPRVLGREFPARSAMAVPVYCQGEIAGAMVVVAGPDRSGRYEPEDREALLILSGYVSVALSDAATRRDLQASLDAARWRAAHDPMTGLPNRIKIVELIDGYLRSGASPTVLYIDVDGFKTANDLYGHHAGDLALVAIGERLIQTVRGDEVVGRLAGDEFVVVLPPMSRAGALSVAERVSASLRDPLEIAGNQIRLPASIGVMVAEADSAEALLDAADHAMYRAKQQSGPRIAVYDEVLRQERLRRLAVEQELRQAVVDMGEFVVHYQPIIEGVGRSTSGYEALLRWTNDTLGPVAPDEFIPVAEQIGLIVDIDLWVLRAVAEQAVEDPTNGPTFSVNMSPATFLAPNLPDALAATIEADLCSPGRLAIEITERVMLGDPAVAARNIEAIRRMGMAVVVDDFGTGYSSLSYLKSLRVDGLKIDRSFVVGAQNDQRGRAVLAAVIGLAHDLGLQPTAEGIETEEQLELVNELGCNRYQGFLFGRPGPLAPTADRRQREALP